MPHKGYPLEIFGGSEAPAKFLCCICQLILRNPVQRYCGHRYCKDCLEEVNAAGSSNTVCPSCVAEGNDDEVSEEESRQLFPDNAIKREMARLKVQCVQAGCSWSGTFKDFMEHFDQHPPAVGGSACPFGCGTELEPEMELDKHVKDSIVQHLELTLSKIVALQKQVGHPSGAAATASLSQSLLVRIGEIENRLEGIQRDIASSNAGASGSHQPPSASAAALPRSASQQQSTSVVTGEKMEIIEGVITVLNREIEKLTLDMEAIERQRRLERELLDTTDRKAKSLERLMALKDATISELTVRITALEQTSQDGTLVWRINEVSKKRQEAVSGRVTSIYSPPFYTSRTGYKMCLRAYLNGDGMGRGTHLSVFFVVMRGNFDALLRWPFRQKVTLMLLNQAQREHTVDAFRPDPTSSSFKRPTTEMNIASGCPLFAPVDVLQNASSGFVKDDQLFIKCIVDASDASFLAA